MSSPTCATRRRLLTLLAASGLTGCAGMSQEDVAAVGASIGQVLGAPGTGGGLGREDIARGLREALRVGTGRAVDELAAADAFYASPSLHIPLPPVLENAQETLRPFGLAGLLDDLEMRLNRGAEQAMPEARAIFWDAISQLTFQDVSEIWRGADDAATRYFERTTSGALAQALREPVRGALDQAGALRLYDQVVAQAGALPGLPDLRADLTRHVLDLALPALFDQLAKEERAIREDPLARTTELLRRVFGSPGA